MKDATTPLIKRITKETLGETPTTVTDLKGNPPSVSNDFLYNVIIKDFNGLVTIDTKTYVFRVYDNGDGWVADYDPIDS